MRHLELRALAKRLAMEAERTQLMARRKAGLLAYIGHEVRNALMTLKGSLHVLPRELLPEKKQQALDHAKRAVDDIDRLTGDVLDASRVELGRFEKREEAVDVRMELDDLGRAYARDAGVALRVEAEPSVPHAVMLDRQRVLQVLHNLVANAFKFTDDGEVRLRVRAVFGRDGADAAREALVFEVEDTGRGMAPSQLQLLFEPFVQADDASPAEGLGLGLFVSRRVAEALGGSLSAESALGRGSTFRLSVPLVPVDA
jgi:signal transduction histidine kinase